MTQRSLLLPLLGIALCACRGNRDRDDDYAYRPAPTGTPTSTSGTTTENDTNEPVAREASAGRMDSFSATDRDFLMKAAQGGMFEVESSRVALMKTTSNPVRDFANMMVNDHGRANQELAQLVTNKGGMLPQQLEGEHQRDVDHLRRLDGAEFEREYVSAQISAHDDAIRLFDQAARNVQDEDIRSFASRTLPTLRKHREQLDTIRQGGTSSTTPR